MPKHPPRRPPSVPRKVLTGWASGMVRVRGPRAEQAKQNSAAWAAILCNQHYPNLL
jgi:hypothetical protein